MKIIKQIIGDRFIKDNIVFFIGSMSVAFLNYLFHPVLSRLLTIEEFGEVQALISLSMQLSIILGVFGMVVVNVWTNTEEEQKRKKLLIELQKFSFLLALVISVGAIFFLPIIKDFLRFESIAPFFSMVMMIPIGSLFIFRSGLLQANKKFIDLSLANIMFSLGRLVFAGILVYIGMSVFGAITGIVISYAVSLAYIWLKTRKDLNFKLFPLKLSLIRELREEIKYWVLALIITFTATFLYTADIVFIKHYFSQEVAGGYSGIAVISRIVLFVTGFIGTVLFPYIKIGEFVHNQKILLKSILITFVLGGFTLALFMLFPDIWISVLIGKKYLTYAYLLPRLSLLIFVISIANLVLNYFLALREYLLYKICLAVIVLITILTVINHDTIEAVINNFYIGTFALFILIALWQFNKRGFFRKKEKV